MNLAPYYPVLLFIIVGIGLGGGLIGVGKLLSPHKPDSEKNAPYECGFEAFEDARMKFDVRYYLVAILFIIFDLETAFLFPWGVALRDIGWPGFLAMMVFLLEFVIGFAFLWKKGALDWE
ncbi:MAG: NADH-quinone oxidoreductase subunit A [Janthinobacterium lividum]